MRKELGIGIIILILVLGGYFWFKESEKTKAPQSSLELEPKASPEVSREEKVQPEKEVSQLKEEKERSEAKEEVSEKVEQPLQVKEFNIIAKQWEFEPDTIRVKRGDRVRLIIESVDVAHGFGLPDFGIDEYLNPGDRVVVEFVADKKGVFPFRCTVYCGVGHSDMRGRLIVE